MKRTIEDIRENLAFVGCDNETALEMCEEIERLRAENTALNAQFRNMGIAPYLDRMREQAEKIERLQSALLAAEDRAASVVREMHLYRDYLTRKGAE